MKNISTTAKLSLSKLRKSPRQVLKKVKKHQVAVMNKRRVIVYIINARQFEAMHSQIIDHEFSFKALNRMSQKADAIEVEIDEL